MRTLVISDIHGNIDALRALDESFDNVILIGDIVDYGPDPAACVDFLRGKNIFRARGNHDHAVAFCVDCETAAGPYRALSLASRDYTMKILDAGQKRWLGEAETAVWVNHGALRMFACHGAPSNHMYKYLSTKLTDEELAREVASVEADIILVGHTHKPFIKQVDGKLLVNVGSVGQPRDGVARICYAIIEDGEPEIRRADYDVTAAVSKTKSLPLDENLREQLIHLLENAEAPPTET